MYIKQIKLRSNGRIAYVACFSSKDDFQGWIDCLFYMANFLSHNKFDQEDAQTLYELASKISNRCDDKYASPKDDVALSSLIFQDEANDLIQTLWVALERLIIQYSKELEATNIALKDEVEAIELGLKKDIALITYKYAYAYLGSCLNIAKNIRDVILYSTCSTITQGMYNRNAFPIAKSNLFLIKKLESDKELAKNELLEEIYADS